MAQILVVKQISRSIQDEFNEKLDMMSGILSSEKTSNQQKIEEVNIYSSEIITNALNLWMIDRSERFWMESVFLCKKNWRRPHQL